MIPTYSELVTLQEASYLEGEEAVDVAHDQGHRARRPQWLEHDADSRALLAWPTRGLAVLTFQGTRNLRGWWRNFNRLRAKYPPGGKVHRGILRSWLELLPQALEHLGDTWEVVVQGHSAGGMIAVPAAGFLIEQDRRKVPLLFTCGKGRVVNRRYGRWLRRHPGMGGMVRCVRHRDPVPFFPLVGSLSGMYQHETGRDGVEDGAKLLFLEEGGRLSWDASRWRRLKHRLLGFSDKTGPNPGLEPTVQDLEPAIGKGAVRLLESAGVHRLDHLLRLTPDLLTFRAGITLLQALQALDYASELSTYLPAALEDGLGNHAIAGYRADIRAAGI